MASLRFWDPARDSNTDIAQPNVLVDNYFQLVQQVQANVASFMRQFLAVHTTTGTAAALVVSQSNAGELRQKETPLSSADVASGITIQPHVAVSAGATLKVGSSPALPIYQTQGAALEAGVLEQARVYHLRLDVNELGAAVWVLVGYWPATELVKPDWDAAEGTAAEILNKPEFGDATKLGSLTGDDNQNPLLINGDVKEMYSFIAGKYTTYTKGVGLYPTALFQSGVNEKFSIRSWTGGMEFNGKFNYTAARLSIQRVDAGSDDRASIDIYGIR